MKSIGKQDTDAQSKTPDAATEQLGLNKETLRDLDALPASDGVKGGFIMKDSVIVRTSH